MWYIALFHSTVWLGNVLSTKPFAVRTFSNNFALSLYPQIISGFVDFDVWCGWHLQQTAMGRWCANDAHLYIPRQGIHKVWNEVEGKDTLLTNNSHWSLDCSVQFSSVLFFSMESNEQCVRYIHSTDKKFGWTFLLLSFILFFFSVPVISYNKK